MKNRLNLNFNLITQQERSDFVTEYLKNFTPTPEELETITNYILWGKSDTENDFELESKHNTWNNNTPESLEGLQESELFSEELIHPLNSTHYIARATKFSRVEARKNPELATQLEPLWRRIDYLDLLICYYDLRHNRRTKPPRDELLARFSASEQSSIEEEASHLNQFQYLKQRHLIVDLRRDQFAIADQYKSSPVMPHHPILITEQAPDMPQFGPLGLCEGDTASPLLFRPFTELHPSNYTPNELRVISNLLWAPHSQEIDLRDPDILTQLILSYAELREDPTFYPLLKTLDYYITESNFEPMYQDILSRKIQRVRNVDIAVYINRTYHKQYTINYISTIFHKKLMPELAATVVQHRAIVENIFFKENFKRCNTCGKMLLLNEHNFVKKARSADGYTNRCKCCDKAARRKAKQ